MLSNLFKFTFYKLPILWKGLLYTVGASQWWMYWIYSTSNFRNLVLEGNLFQVVVINNELPNPIQLNIETLSRHEMKCTRKFIISVVNWKVKLLSKETERRGQHGNFTMCFTKHDCQSHNSTRYFLPIHAYTPIKYWIRMQ